MGLSPSTPLGPYEVLDLLGAGGMGEVWRARDTRLGREVALKVLPDSFASDHEHVTRFQREAQLLAALNHPHIASIYSFETVDGVRVLVMELVPGETIRQLLYKGPLPLPRALGIAHDVAEALGAAHAKGILHRDLKPSNVKVTQEGKVKLLDFGLAKAFAPGSGGSDLSESPTLEAGASQQGVVLGTAPYMSPEQARGAELDARSDVWAFGCLVYEMLTGKKAFNGPTASDILVAILDHEPDWTALPPDTPLPVIELLKACLAKRVDERLPDLAHAQQQIDLVRTGQTPFVPLSTVPTPRVRRRALPFAAGGIVLLAIAAGIGWFALRDRAGGALPATKLLAILPATDLTGREDGRQLCDGVSFSLGVKLQSVAGLSIMRPSGPAMLKETDPAIWARDTGANLLVLPAVRQMGDTRQISFAVFLAGSPVQLAAGEVTGPAAEHFRLEDEANEKLTAALRIHLAGGGLVPATGLPAITPGAGQTDYIVALGCLERYDDKDSVQKAIELLAKIPDGEKSALVQAALGRSYLASYNLSKDVTRAELAKKTAERAIALDPDLPEAQVTLGQILTATGEAGKAAGVLLKASERRPNDAEAVRALALALNKAGRPAEAEQAFLRVVELKPRAWSAYNLLGFFYFGASQYQKAVDAYERGIQLNPEVARLHYNLGAAYLKCRRNADAEKAFRRSIEIKPQPTALSNLGTLYYIQGKYPDAANAFSRAVELGPLDYWNHKALADALFRVPGGGDRSRAAYTQASRLAQDALRVDPKSGEAHAVIGASASKTKSPDAGLDEIRRALTLEPNNPIVLHAAAIVFATAGRTIESLDAIEHGLEHGLSVDEIETEPDLATLHGNPRYRTILDKHLNRKEST